MWPQLWRMALSFSLLLMQNRAVIDILWSVHFESYISCYNYCNRSIPTWIFKKLLSFGIVWHLHNYHWNSWQIQTVKPVYIAVEKYLLIHTNVTFASVTENAYLFSLLMRKIIHLVKETLSEVELAGISHIPLMYGYTSFPPGISVNSENMLLRKLSGARIYMKY